MIRIFFILISFIAFGNFNYVVNDLILLSLINIAIYSVLREKKFTTFDFIIFILSTLCIEILIGLPLFISSSLAFLLLYMINYVINNLSINKIINSLIFFILSIFVLFSLDLSLYGRINESLYLLSFFILLILYISLSKYGKK